MITVNNDSAARDRILRVAQELFYKQGYQATGINQIIKDAEVAKATFYSHFPTKEDLLVEYVRLTSEKETELLRQEIRRRTTPLSKFMATIELLEPWLTETNFRGCPFLNLVPEITDPDSTARKLGSHFYREHEDIVREAAQNLIASDAKKYGHLKASKLAQQYMTIFAGAIALSEIHHDLTPVKAATQLIREIVH